MQSSLSYPTNCGFGCCNKSKERRNVRVAVVVLRKQTCVSPAPQRPFQQEPQEVKQQPAMVSENESESLSNQADHQKQQLLSKAWNFLAGASGVVIFPYLNVYLSQRGLSSSEIGLLAALRPWLSAPVSMVATGVADRYKIHTQLLVALGALSMLLRSSLPLAGGVPLLFTMLLAAELTGAPTNVLADATVLSNCKDLSDYGKQRQWASIGYGLASLPAGWLIASAGLNSAFLVYGLACLPLIAVGTQMRYNYRMSNSSGTTAIAASCDGPLEEQQQQQREREREPARPGLSGNSLKTPLLDPAAAPAAAPAGPPPAKAAAAAAAEDGWSPPGTAGTAGQPSLRQVLLQPQALVFLWRCLLMGFGMGIMANFEFLWLKELGAPETLMGLAIAFSICTEVPAFMLQGSILQRISPSTALNIVLAATALRLACYAALPWAHNVWAVLPVELLHGITFGVGWGTATVYSSKLAPPQLSATMQGLFQATYGGVGAGLGGLVGGVLLEREGGQGLFLAAAAIVAAGGLLGALADSAASLAAGQLRPQLAGSSRSKSE